MLQNFLLFQLQKFLFFFFQIPILKPKIKLLQLKKLFISCIDVHLHVFLQSGDSWWSFTELTRTHEEGSDSPNSPLYEIVTFRITASRKFMFLIVTQVFPLMLLGAVSTLSFFMSAGRDSR